MAHLEALQRMFSLEGKTAIVTGGTRGIGQAMAIALAEAGADVILVQRDESNKSTLEQIQQLGRKATIITANLADQSSISQVIPNLIKAGYDMHILVNCGGVQKRHPAHQFPLEDWTTVLQTNLNTPFTLCRDFGAYLLSKPLPEDGSSRGSIINVASLQTFQGGITIPAYAASKGGIGQLTKALSNEWAKEGIKVNAIAPGYVDTEMNTALINNPVRARQIFERMPIGRWGKPEDFKGAIIFLASEASKYVSGEVLTVDGGWMGR